MLVQSKHLIPAPARPVVDCLPLISDCSLPNEAVASACTATLEQAQTSQSLSAAGLPVCCNDMARPGTVQSTLSSLWFQSLSISSHNLVIAYKVERRGWGERGVPTPRLPCHHPSGLCWKAWRVHKITMY